MGNWSVQKQKKRKNKGVWRSGQAKRKIKWQVHRNRDITKTKEIKSTQHLGTGWGNKSEKKKELGQCRWNISRHS